ncbi:sigma factor-like helix-turn-helix DNA-binding protein [Methanopyrus sp.]
MRSGINRDVIEVLMDVYDLTERQATVSVMRSDGMSYREIAEELGITVSGVRNHLEQARMKMKVDNDFQIARIIGRLEMSLGPALVIAIVPVDKSEDVINRLIQEGEGVTEMTGRGGYTGEEQSVLFIITEDEEKVREIIEEEVGRKVPMFVMRAPAATPSP